MPRLTAMLATARSQRRSIVTSAVQLAHENPLGIPMSGAPPTIPRAQRGLPSKRRIPGVKKVVICASGKGGVGKSTISVNLALALAKVASTPTKQARVGLLDLDIFGPSIPKLMGLDQAFEPELTQQNRLVPFSNHGAPCMSMGFLLPPSANSDQPIVWRGMMIMKAVQQLLFDVDWKASSGFDTMEPDLDVLVIDMPPGTGDVQLSVGQLIQADGAVIVSTPQDVALIDVRKGTSMFRKVGIPILGGVLNMSHFRCPSCTEDHRIFGSADSFNTAMKDMGLDKLADIPLELATSKQGDAGKPIVLSQSATSDAFIDLARKVWERI